jgi:hypothetical protein
VGCGPGHGRPAHGPDSREQGQGRHHRLHAWQRLDHGARVRLRDEIRRDFPDIEIVVLQFAMAGGAKAMELTENLLTAHPAPADIFADNESSSAGAAQTSRAATRATSSWSPSTLPTSFWPT